MKQRLLFTLALAVISIPLIAYAGTLTMTTYYPAPTGNYDVLSANSVGIGTYAYVGSQLQVSGQGTGYGIIGNSGCGNGYTGLRLAGSAMGGCANYNMLASNNDNNLYLNHAANGWMFFRQGNATQMLIDETGNLGIGIGDVAPGYRLLVNGSIHSSAAKNELTYSGGNLASTYYDVAGEHIGSISTYGYRSICAGNNSGECTGNGGIVLGVTNANATSNIPNAGATFFNNGGNVGIGVTAPAYKLDLGGLANGGSIGYGESSTRTERKDNAGSNLNNNGTLVAQSGFYQTVAPVNYPAGANLWWHLLDVRHSNPANNYAMQISGSFYDQEMFFRKTNNNATQAWSRIVNEDANGVSKILSVSHPLYFTSSWTGYANNTTSEISNDTTAYQTLMLVGNTSGGGGIRRVSVWDKLTVNGNFVTTGLVGIGSEPDARFKLYISGDVGVNGDIYNTTGGYYYGAPASDERLKENIHPITHALDKVKALNGVTFNWKKDKKKSVGVVAQNVEKVFPELVYKNKEGIRHVLYENLVGVLIESTKEQQQQIDALKKEVAELRKKIK